MDHWPNIISILQRELLPTINSDSYAGNRRLVSSSYYRLLFAYVKKPAASECRLGKSQVIFYDQKVDSTYILASVAQRLVVSIVFVGRFDDRRGSGLTTAFIEKLGT